VYDTQGQLISMILNNVEYAYVRNAQNDIVGLINSAGIQVVSYTYSTWGEVLSITGSLASSVGEKNPYRYRGYRYDSETQLYYLQSRYYNPQWGRFLNADTTDVLTASPAELTDKNLYAYCDNNPVVRVDVDGMYWFIIASVVGGVTGFSGQVLADLVTSRATGKMHLSNSQTYIGAAVGGAVGGLVLATTGQSATAGALSGAFTTAVGQGLEKLTIKDYDKSWAEIGGNIIGDGIVGGLTGAIPGVNKITKGRNSMQAVYKSGMTKMIRGSAARMGLKVIVKGTASTFLGGVSMDVYYGVKQASYATIKSILVN